MKKLSFNPLTHIRNEARKYSHPQHFLWAYSQGITGLYYQQLPHLTDVPLNLPEPQILVTLPRKRTPQRTIYQGLAQIDLRDAEYDVDYRIGDQPHVIMILNPSSMHVLWMKSIHEAMRTYGLTLAALPTTDQQLQSIWQKVHQTSADFIVRDMAREFTLATP